MIKPCKVYNVDNEVPSRHQVKKQGIFAPRRKNVEDIVTSKLVYWEYLNLANNGFVN